MILTALIIALVTSTPVTVGASEPEACRCYPGYSCWPSPYEWDDFNASVDGRLIRTIPLGHVCHDPTYDEDACRHLRRRWNAPETHIDSSHSLMVPVYANDSCSPWAERGFPCTLGAYVHYAVNVSSLEHVVTTLDFVRGNNIRLVIRNTGHDYLGKSSGPGSLALWTHHLKSLKLLEWDSEIYRGKAIKLGAGVQGSEAIEFAAQHNLTVLTGNCPSVGIAGGYIHGGGHSAMSSKYGLAADQLLEMEVVTAAGTHKVVSRHHEPELFWALSGGGGGTYAVVLSVTVRTYADLPSAAATLEFNAADVGERKFLDGVELFQATLPAWHDAGCSTVYSFTHTKFSLQLLVCHGKTTTAILELLRPFTSALDSLRITHHHTTTGYAKWSHGARVGWLDKQQYKVNQMQAATWLIPRSSVLHPATNAQIIAAILRIQDLGAGVGIQTFGPSTAVAAATDNAVFPGWRDAALLVWVILPSDDAMSLERLLRDQRRLSGELMPVIQAVAPGGGTYLNEADAVDGEWKRNSFGRNYGPLLDVKRRYDPEGLFYARHAVGSDAWVQTGDGRLCRAPEQGLREDDL